MVDVILGLDGGDPPEIVEPASGPSPAETLAPLTVPLPRHPLVVTVGRFTREGRPGLAGRPSMLLLGFGSPAVAGVEVVEPDGRSRHLAEATLVDRLVV